jgi:hypothetical protein
VAVSPQGEVHVVWEDYRDTPGSGEIYYKRNSSTQGFAGCLTDSSNARHLLRDPTRGVVHFVFASEEDSIYYTRSTNDGVSWSLPTNLGTKGRNPAIGLAMQNPTVYPPWLAVCIAYNGGRNLSGPGELSYFYNDGFSDPGSGTWHYFQGISGDNPGAPSLITVGSQVYVAYLTGPPLNQHLVCQNFPFDYNWHVIETIDNSTYTSRQPSLSADVNGAVYAVWQRDNQIYYTPRAGGTWPPPRRMDQVGPSQQPFTECYAESVFAVWSEGSGTASEVWRAGFSLNDPLHQWYYVQVTNNSVPSVSPTQAFREFTTWSEGTSGQPDIYYYSPNTNWGRGAVEANTPTWSYWPHSQMTYVMSPMGTAAYLWSAWTESPNPGLPPYTVLTKKTYFPPPPPPGGGDSFGSYYSVQAGQDTASPYCRKRDGVLHFGNKSVDFARDSLIYELPYLDPLYDYYVKIASYRETGSNWAQAISLSGLALRTVQFAPSVVDTAWLRIPRALYRRDRKVVFTAKNVRGDYVTLLGMVLYQVDPTIQGGGPQSSGSVSTPVREVFSAYPNPTTFQTQIQYSLKTSGRVSLSVYDVGGRLVQRIVDAEQPAGVYRETWDGRGQDGQRASPGVYFIRLSVPGKVQTARVVVVR